MYFLQRVSYTTYYKLQLLRVSNQSQNKRSWNIIKKTLKEKKRKTSEIMLTL